MSSNFTMTIPDISSINGASTMTNLCTFGFISTFSLGKKGKDLFEKLKQESHKSMTPSSSKMFLIPKTKSAFLWISETKVYISNMWPCMSTITSIINSAPTYCTLCIFEANLGNACRVLHHKWNHFGM